MTIKKTFKKLFSKISDSVIELKQRIFSIRLFRWIKLYFYQRFFLYLSRIFITALILSLLGAIYLYLFQPQKISDIYGRSKSKLIEIIDSKIFKSYKIEVIGTNRINQQDIKEAIQKVISEKNYQSNQSLLIQDIVDYLRVNFAWLKEVTVVRTLPNNLNIFIKEYKPFAIWNNNDKLQLIDEEGNQMPYYESDEFDDMIIISGTNANVKYKSLFNIFSLNEEISQNVYSATWIGNRRWNIRFKNGVLVKLPENNISKAWDRLSKLHQIKGSDIGLKIIDLRISDKIYLEYKDNIRKTLN